MNPRTMILKPTLEYWPNVALRQEEKTDGGGGVGSGQVAAEVTK